MMARTLIVLGAFALTACSFHARSADNYRKVTRDLLETKSDGITACYKEALKQTPGVSGTVTVNFEVEAKTGKVVNPAVDTEASTAPEQLHPCVLQALEGLTLDPPDQRTGQASFVYELTET